MNRNIRILNHQELNSISGGLTDTTVAGVVGGAVGGASGSALGGAAAGALAGSVAGPVGTALGGIIGCIAGALGAISIVEAKPSVTIDTSSNGYNWGHAAAKC